MSDLDWFWAGFWIACGAGFATGLGVLLYYGSAFVAGLVLGLADRWKERA